MIRPLNPFFILKAPTAPKFIKTLPICKRPLFYSPAFSSTCRIPPCFSIPPGLCASCVADISISTQGMSAIAAQLAPRFSFGRIVTAPTRTAIVARPCKFTPFPAHLRAKSTMADQQIIYTKDAPARKFSNLDFLPRCDSISGQYTDKKHALAVGPYVSLSLSLSLSLLANTLH